MSFTPKCAPGLVSICALLVASATQALGYALMGFSWPAGADIEMHLDLNRAAVNFQDGSSSWNASAADALRIWNQHLETVRFVTAAPVSNGRRDGANSVFFSSTVYGESFGTNTVAVTVGYNDSSNTTIVETDVIFNSSERWNSYRGPLQRDSRGVPTLDLHRVALHEFGHVLGLNHPDQHGQAGVHALMNSEIGDNDSITEDDISGARQLYAVRITSQLTAMELRLGQSLTYQITATNRPTSFSAAGLPPGLQLDPATGAITGMPARSGTYDIVLTAHGVRGDAIATLRVIVPAPRITSSLSAPSAIVGDQWQWYRITADNQATSFEAVGLPPGLSVDSASGAISGVPTVSGHYYVKVAAHGLYESARADLSMRVFPAPPPQDEPLGGAGVQAHRIIADPSRARIYCATGSGVVVVDSHTYATVARIGSSHISDISLSADGRSLWMAPSPTGGGLARVDLESLRSVAEFPIRDSFSVIREGLENRLYLASQNGDILQIDANTGEIQQRFRPESGNFPRGPSLTFDISADRKTLYVSEDSYRSDTRTTVVGLSRFDVTSATPSLLQRAELPLRFIRYVVVPPTGDAVFLVVGLPEMHDGFVKYATVSVAAADVSFENGRLNFSGQGAQLAFSADGRIGYQGTTTQSVGSVKVFDTATLQQQRSIEVGSGPSFLLSGVAVERTGSRLFAATYAFPLALRAFALTSTPPPTPPKQLLNVSTRLRAQTGDDILIGGFIITGAEPKKVILRAIGPSLPLSGQLADPVLELFASDGARVALDDNWNARRREVLSTGMSPPDERESAIVATLPPGNYTASVGGINGSSGVALVELFDLEPAKSQIANISTRGKVEVDDNVMIGGFIIGGDQRTRVIVRAIGPSLEASGVPGALEDTALELYDGNGTLLASNDDWRTHQQREIAATTIPPNDDRESAIVRTLDPGNYTAVVRGKSDTTGVALVEVFNLETH